MNEWVRQVLGYLVFIWLFYWHSPHPVLLDLFSWSFPFICEKIASLFVVAWIFTNSKVNSYVG